MLDRGATSFWETELGWEDFDYAGSLCHGWSAIPLYLYGAYGLGIRAAGSGEWSKHPSACPLRIKATLKTPQGYIHSENNPE